MTPSIRKSFFFLIFIFIIDCSALCAQNEDVLEVGKFSNARIDDGLPTGWEPLTFKQITSHSEYKLIRDQGQVVIKATTRSAASGLVRKISINPGQYPIVQWKWKITGIYPNGDATRREGDDYPARLYVTFAYDPQKVGFFEKAKYEAAKLLYGEYPPIGAINYIWANRAPIGTIIKNPYTSRAKMIPCQSGAGKKGRWITEQRNVYDDYMAAFGEPPPLISGVAIMADSDNTGGATISYFGDIIFKKRPTPAD